MLIENDKNKLQQAVTTVFEQAACPDMLEEHSAGLIAQTHHIVQHRHGGKENVTTDSEQAARHDT